VSKPLKTDTSGNASETLSNLSQMGAAVGEGGPQAGWGEQHAEGGGDRDVRASSAYERARPNEEHF
jgi:hypothetical protein